MNPAEDQSPERARRLLARLRYFTPGLALAVLSWPIGSLAPLPGLDGSWTSALHLAAVDRLDFGHEIVFTYGPLGWLFIPRMLNPTTGVLAVIAVSLLHIAFVCLIYRLLERRFGVVPSVLMGFALTQALPNLLAPETTALFAVMCCVALVIDPPPRHRINALTIVGGGIAALLLLVKLNGGVIAGAAILVTALVLAEGKALALLNLAGGFVGAFVLLWVTTGQSLTAVPAYLSSSLEITSGYSSAMALEEQGRELEHYLIPITLIVIALMGWEATQGLARRRIAGLIAIGAILWFGSFKLGFVRHDGHSISYFTYALLAPIAIIPKKGSRIVPMAYLAILFCCLVIATRVPALTLLDPKPQLQNLAASLEEAFIPSSRSALIESRRAQLRSEYALDQPILDRIEGATAHIDPYETTLAWAYPELDWHPVPNFQSYSAYTVELDDMNARFLASDEAPRYILREPVAGIDERNATFESPAASLEMLCKYREAYRGIRWQLLERTEERCGEPRLLEEVPATTGEAVAIPAAQPDEIVYAAIEGTGDTLTDKLTTLLYRGDVWLIDLPGDGNYRLVPDTAAQPLILHVPAGFDYAAPFELGSVASTLTVSRARPSERALEISYYAIPVEN